MDPVLQRHCAKYIYAIPEGLRELMSDISREILRSQPDQLYTFIADYLDALLITRENARVAARLVEVIIEIGKTTVEFLLRVGLTRAEANSAVTKIQTAFRNHLARKKHLKLVEETAEEEQEFLDSVMVAIDLPENRYFDDAARIIQRAYREFKEREAREKDLLRGIVDWRVAAKSTINLYRRTGVTFAEANRAATLIKAAYKGYYTRRVMRRLLEQGTKEYIESIEGYPEYDEEKLEEEEEEWGWCYCFVEEQDKVMDKTPPVSEETPTTAVSSIMSSLIKSVIPSSEIIETLQVEEGDQIGMKEHFAEEETKHPSKENIKEMPAEDAERPPEGTTEHVPEEAITTVTKQAEEATREIGPEAVEAPPSGRDETLPPAEHEVPPPVEALEVVEAIPDTENIKESAQAETEAGEILPQADEIQAPTEPGEAQELPAAPEVAEE